jgi:murein DD-endopeptidase MepM/ murein hydrolase activator NlpD
LLAPVRTLAREVRIRPGDTASSLFSRLGVDDIEALDFLQTSKESSALFRQIVPGKVVGVSLSIEGKLHSLSFPLNGGTSRLEVWRSEKGLSTITKEAETESGVVLQTAVIRHSLFGAADEAGIPESVASRLADIFGGDIDFHRDLRKGDRFSVVYATASHLGKPISSERILAAEFVNDGKRHRAFWYQDRNNTGGYYNADGRSIKKAFLRSPLEFSRITSGFSGARFHPVLQAVRAHRGIDYGAPIGTRVKATGDGTIEFSGSQGGYGNVVMVRHPGERLTIYGHLSGFASGIRKGIRVTQGDVIGYVGATGLASGPHLHYELRVAGLHRNPLTVTLPAAPALPHASLRTFLSHAEEMGARLETAGDLRWVMLD